MKALSTDALVAIGRARVEGNLVYLDEPLSRPLYVEVNKALESIGGDWKKGLKAHQFPSNPHDAIGEVIENGGWVDRRQVLGFFESPMAIAKRVIDEAEILPGHVVLEPSAGKGALIREIARQATTKWTRRGAVGVVKVPMIRAVEIDPEHIPSLRGLCLDLYPATGAEVVNQDFLEWATGQGAIHDRVAMNPPFVKQADIDHVRCAFELLRPGGKLVSVMSPSFTFRTNSLSRNFREFVDRFGRWEMLPSESFKASGTMVETVLVSLRRP